MTSTLRRAPTLRVDGDTIRQLREEKGLTQLYVAEVARVSVDTVSRWENNRTPGVRRENVEALAEALGVAVDALVLADQDAADPGDTAELPAPGRRAWPAALLGAAVGAATALVGVTLVQQARAPAELPPALPALHAERRLPPYTPPATEVPVTVEVRAAEGSGARVVLRETLPPGWAFAGSSTPPDHGPGPEGTLKWILPLERGTARVAYLVQAPADGPEGSFHRFLGEIVPSEADATPVAVRGEARIDLEYVHWADQDADFQVSDGEVLAALERLEAARGLQGLDPADIRSLWGAPQYTWDRALGRFRPR